MATPTDMSKSPPDAEAIIARESNYPELQDLLQKALQIRPTHDIELISKAYHCAELAHRNHYRKSGQPTIRHATEVAQTLIDLNLDTTTVAAGLLHDVVEDTGIPLSQISAQFGDEIAGLVDGVTKIRDLTFRTPAAEQAENFRKMLLSMAQDIRVVLVKFADRLHNLHTLKYLKPETRRQMALESRDIYAPLAHRLGMARIRSELEDLSLKWLEPEAYRDIQKKINLTRKEREAYIEQVHASLQEALQKGGIQADIKGRPKNFHSVYRKIATQGKAFEEIFDLLAIRILVNTVPECYNALGVVHANVHTGHGPVQGLHRHPQEQHVPVPAHHRRRSRRGHGGDPDPDLGDAPDRRSRHRGPLALQRGETRPLGPGPAHGLAAQPPGVAAGNHRPARIHGRVEDRPLSQ